jgi:hypothetical protein
MEQEGNEVPVTASHMAYFLVPLPDALGLPTGYQQRLIERTPEDLVMEHGL